MGYINLNGKVISNTGPMLPVDTRAFRYGYGLFETLLIRDNNILLKQFHWERLFDGMKKLYFDIPLVFTGEKLEHDILETVKKNQLEKLCRVRLQVFASGGGLFDPENDQPQYLIECFKLDEEVLHLNDNGVVVGLAAGLKKSVDSRSNIKSCNALIYAIAARQAKENKWNDALILNTSGNVIESTIANIFLVKNKVVYTPPLSDGCIAGVMRRKVIETHKDIVEKSISIPDLLTADEIFLTNAIKGVRWVGNFQNVFYNNTMIRKNFIFQVRRL